MGAAFCGVSQKVLSIPKSATLTIDNLTYGPGIVDVYTQTKCTNIRAVLSATAGTAASGTITYTTAPADGNCVYLNGVVYQFETVNSATVSGYVKVVNSATANTAWTNLKNAINLQDQAVTATINTGTGVVTLTSNYSGVYGNSYTIADGDASAAHTTGATFSSANLASGANGTIPVVTIW